MVRGYGIIDNGCDVLRCCGEMAVMSENWHDNCKNYSPDLKTNEKKNVKTKRDLFT